MIEYTTEETKLIRWNERRQIEKKVLPEYYKGIRTHKKMFEIRKDEDGIKPGDILVLREWDGEKYMGGRTRREVTAVLRDCPEYGLMPGYCILSLQVPGWDYVRPSACLDAEVEEKEEKRFPVGGVDRSDKVDRISIQNAVEMPLWMAVWAAEPERMIDVRMSYSDLKVICDLIDQKRKAAEWHYSDKERPTKAGLYWCVLIHDEYMDCKPTGGKCAELETRWYGNVEDDVSRSWVMDGEPETGMVWTEEMGSWIHERVYAWKPTLKNDPSTKEIRLPDGVEWGPETWA